MASQPMLQLATDRDSTKGRCQTLNIKVKRNTLQNRSKDLSLGALMRQMRPRSFVQRSFARTERPGVTLKLHCEKVSPHE